MPTIREFFKPRRAWLFGTLILAFLEIFVLHTQDTLQHKLSDLFVKIQANYLVPDQDIVIVEIDESSLTRMNEKAGSWPWPRSVHGELIEGIRQQKPKAIVFDIWFAEKDKFRLQSDVDFNRVLSETPNVYLPMLRLDEKDDQAGTRVADLAPALWGKDSKSTPVPGDPAAKASLLLPRAVDEANWRIGLINFIKDDDGVGRRYYVNYPLAGWSIPSLPVRVAQDLGYPIPKQESIMLNWRGIKSSFPRISYGDLYHNIKSDKKWRVADELHDKIVIIGATADGLYDIRPTPLDSVYPGTKILATAIDNLKNQRAMTVAPQLLLVGLTAALVLALYFTFRFYRSAVKNSLVLLFVATTLVTLSFILLAHQYLLPVFSPIAFAIQFYLGSTFIDYLRERNDKENAVKMFSRFVNPHVVKELIASGGLSRGGERREVTLLFSDIRGFTSLSESRPPEELVKLLNNYFSMQVEVIFKHGGSLDKFIGDAIMAFWGAPLDDANQAEHAITAALEMYEQVQVFRAEMGEIGKGFDVGIGLHTGPAVVGLIGAEQRREYTAIGDTVNLASRIEGLTKGLAPILVSEDTMNQCPDAFIFIDRGSHPVKGRVQDVRLFEPRRKPV